MRRALGRRIDRRAFMKASAAAAAGLSLPSSLMPPSSLTPPSSQRVPETLYNGIRLGDPWPPRWREFPDESVRPLYLLDPPAVIPIDLGRQLLVDDFLIEETSLERTFHRAEYYGRNPVLFPTAQWEKYDEYAERTKTRPNPAAMPFSDGVFYDPAARLFKMWYMGGYDENTCYAVSDDGLTWHKPSLDVMEGTNIVKPPLRDSNTVWLDLTDPDESRRYKMASYNGNHRGLDVYLSRDGIHWRSVGKSGPAGDRTTFFYNPFRKVWVFSLRDSARGGLLRYRRYWEASDFVTGTEWKAGQPLLWARADSQDPPRPDYKIEPQLYNLDCVAYESVLLGLFTIFRGEQETREKPNDVCLGFSRDGFHWDRPDRRPFIPVSEQVGDWNWANVQSSGGCCLIVGDRLHFYVSGRHGIPGTSAPGVCSTGLAMLRRDGFASMDDAPKAGAARRVGESLPPGTLTTRPVRFTGRYLFVNVDCAGGGELRVEVLDRTGRLIEPYSAAASVPIRKDTTCARVLWSGAHDLARLAGEAVRFRFRLTRGKLYAFWVSPSPRASSHGYAAAGGPGLSGATDTVGTNVGPE